MLCKMGLTSYTTSTVRDIYTFAVFCSVTRPFFVSPVEVGRIMVYTTRKTVNRIASIHLNPLAPERSKEK